MRGTHVETLPWVVWSGCGNAYAFVDLRGAGSARVAAAVERAPALARGVRAAAGPGTDGLVLVTDDDRADARLAVWNVDGSRGAVCGNALRCLARLVAAERGAPSAELLLAGDAGLHPARVARDAAGAWHAWVSLARPAFGAAAIPLDAAHPAVVGRAAEGPFRIAVEFAGGRGAGLALSVGNPHLVLPLEVEPEDVAVAELGAALERHRAFPDRVNVSFVRVVDRHTLRQRTYERGSGETAACGSGACAAVVALTATGALERDAEVAVQMRGGTLGVRWSRAGDLWLGGATERLGQGAFELPSTSSTERA